MAAKVLILRSPGTNCDRESAYAFELAGAETEAVHINALRADPGRLKDFQAVMLPGGFSYGDDLGAGKVLANEIRYHLLDAFRAFIEEGKLILGICNGFQVLVKSGLLPFPFEDLDQSVTLTWNDSHRYEDRWVTLKISGAKSDFIRGEKTIELPVAHGEGRFLPKDEAILERLRENGQIALQYAHREGKEIEYPWNPNGSVDHIAGISDPTGRVLGLMPHPERFVRAEQHPRWTRESVETPADGLEFFLNAVNVLGDRFG